MQPIQPHNSKINIGLSDSWAYHPKQCHTSTECTKAVYIIPVLRINSVTSTDYHSVHCIIEHMRLVPQSVRIVEAMLQAR